MIPGVGQIGKEVTRSDDVITCFSFVSEHWGSDTQVEIRSELISDAFQVLSD